MKIIEKDFYIRNTLDAAKDLLGCIMVRKDENGLYQVGKIVETEAYTQNDPACHAYRGKTKRSSTLFKEGGLAYVYFTYGMYHCMNIVTEEEESAAAVLIRALEPLENVENTNGPGKLCREMHITRDLNELPVYDKNSQITVYYGEKTPEENIVQTTRIGIKVAQDYPWRFYDDSSKYVSKKIRKSR